MSNSIKSFFETIADRLHNENDLSDFTWAMCWASPEFKRIFINYFFPEINVGDVENIYRECTDGNNMDSRVDFYILLKNDSKPYLIEVKKYDNNHHFGQYEDAYEIEKERLGYITNYPLRQGGYDVKQWDEFYNHLTGKLGVINDDEKLLVEGYLEYLKKVCGIIKFTKKMDLNGAYSLYELFFTIEKLLKQSTDNYSLDLYGKNETTLGVEKRWFGIEFTNCNFEKEWGVIGLWYDRENPCLCIGFHKSDGWGGRIYKIIEKAEKEFENNEWYGIPYKEENVYYFELKQEKMDEFNKLGIAEQEEFLKNFIDAVLMYVKTLVMQEHCKNINN